MPYTQTEWNTGDVITEALIDKIEQGIDDAHAGLIDDGAIATAKLANLAVTEGKLADTAVATAKLANDAVTNAKLRNSAALSVVGRAANSTGDPADIAAGSDGQVLRRSGTSLGFGQVATAGIADSAVTGAKLASQAVGVDPVIVTGTDRTLSASSSYTLEAGIWYVRTPTADHKVEVFADTPGLGGYERIDGGDAGSSQLSVVLVVSNGSNVRFVNSTGGNLLFSYWRVYP